MIPTFTIADCAFMPGSKSESLGGENHGLGPTHFEWELAAPREARFVTDAFLKDAPGKGQVAWLSESFFLHPENYWMALQKPFDYVLTHNRYWAENHELENWLWQPHGGSWIDLNRWGMQEKTHGVSMILSEKRSLPGHKLRHAVAEEYRFRNLIDAVYGYVNERVGKFDGLAPFQYSVVIESERCPGFFSEKLIDCMAVGTIPIYWGCQDVERYFDMSGVIRVEDMVGIEHALMLARDVDDMTWRKEAAARNMEKAKRYRISEDWIWEHYPFLFEV